MPELPEVETIRSGLEPIVGVEIRDCRVRRRDVVRDQWLDNSVHRRGPIEPGSLLVGASVVRLERKGKQLALIGSNGRVIVIQLGMSGQVGLTSATKIPNAKHVHIVWILRNGQRMFFRDTRRFGGIVLYRTLKAHEHAWSRLGPDALNISTKDLQRALSRTQRAIKVALLDQHLLAGVGNIYADESLFDAGINPFCISDALEHKQVVRLAGSIRKILARAIKARGSTLRDYRDTDAQPGSAQLEHMVYARAGQPCLVCGTTLRSTRMAQRITCWCPRCQPACTEQESE